MYKSFAKEMLDYLDYLDKHSKLKTWKRKGKADISNYSYLQSKTIAQLADQFPKLYIPTYLPDLLRIEKEIKVAALENICYDTFEDYEFDTFMYGFEAAAQDVGLGHMDVPLEYVYADYVPTELAQCFRKFEAMRETIINEFKRRIEEYLSKKKQGGTLNVECK